MVSVVQLTLRGILPFWYSRHRQVRRATRHARAGMGDCSRRALDRWQIDSLCADVVVSDSCLCAVSSEYQDRHGQLINGLIDVPVRPWWGASFLRGTFRRCVYNAWKEFQDAKTILVLVAGNDVLDENDPRELEASMVSLRDYWLTGDVSVIYVDAVPTGAAA